MSIAIKSGSQCLDLVNQVSVCYKSDPQVAQNHLEVIKNSSPLLLEELKSREKEREKKRDDLKHEESSLQYRINSKEAEKSKLRSQIRDIEARRARNEAQLKDRENDLRRAEENKSKASSKKDGAVAGTVVGGVGAVVLGIFFPPSLAVTVPAVAAAGTISIKEACEAVDNCRGRIRDVEQLIANDKRQIDSANSEINAVQQDIASLQSRLKSLYSDRGQLRMTISFLHQAVTYFSELQVAVEGGQQRTELLHKLMQHVNKKQQYKILDSKGMVIVANNFVEAWRRVEDSVMNGKEAGFVNIEFDDLSKIEY